MLLKVVKPYSDHKMLKLLSFQNLFFSACTILLLKLIAKQGDEVKRLYFIAKGNIEVVKHDETVLTLGGFQQYSIMV